MRGGEGGGVDCLIKALKTRTHMEVDEKRGDMDPMSGINSWHGPDGVGDILRTRWIWDIYPVRLEVSKV